MEENYLEWKRLLDSWLPYRVGEREFRELMYIVVFELPRFESSTYYENPLNGVGVELFCKFIAHLNYLEKASEKSKSNVNMLMLLEDSFKNLSRHIMEYGDVELQESLVGVKNKLFGYINLIDDIITSSMVSDKKSYILIKDIEDIYELEEAIGKLDMGRSKVNDIGKRLIMREVNKYKCKLEIVFGLKSKSCDDVDRVFRSVRWL